MTKIKLNDGVKIEKHAKDNYKKKYPFTDMKVGDWFTVDLSKNDSVRQLAYNYGYKEGKKFTTAGAGGLITITRIE